MPPVPGPQKLAPPTRSAAVNSYPRAATKDADCAFNDTLVLCHKNTGHKPGKHIQNGWAYTRDSSDGRCGVFVLDKPFKRRWKR